MSTLFYPILSNQDKIFLNSLEINDNHINHKDEIYDMGVYGEMDNDLDKSNYNNLYIIYFLQYRNF